MALPQYGDTLLDHNRYPWHETILHNDFNNFDNPHGWLTVIIGLGALVVMWLALNTLEDWRKNKNSRDWKKFKNPR